MDWTTGPDLTTRFKRFRQKCELLFEGPLKPRAPEQKCSYLLLWAGDYGLDLYNTWSLTTEQKKGINEYWKRFEEHAKPQANKILNRYYLRNLKQNGRPLDAFFTEARLLIQNCGYADEMEDEIMRDTLVFGTDHEAVRKKCITKGNNQLRAMDAPVPPTQVDSPSERQNKSIKSDTPSRRLPGDPTRCQRCGNNQHQRGQRCPASGVECFNCHNRGHFRKMCKTKKANVHEVQGGQHNQGAQGSEDAVNFPSDDTAHSLFLALLCMNLGHQGSTIFSLEIQFLLFKWWKLNKSRGVMTLLWQRPRMLLRNNNMQERYRIPRNFKVESRYKLLKSLFNITKTQQEMQSLAVENISWYNTKKNADLAISCLLYLLPHHTVMLWFSLQ